MPGYLYPCSGISMTTIHMIANAHIDPVWLWVWQEGLEVALSTCRDAVGLLERYPEYRFVRSSAAVYRWIERVDPQLFVEISALVEEGRWDIVNGWWVQPDCNLPCGESLVRQGLYGQLYFEERFGRKARVGFNVDTFGHCASLPQILRKCGLTSYVFHRPGVHEKKLPNDLFRWESPDGSRVLAARIDGYGAGSVEDLEKKVETAIERCRKSGMDTMCFYGRGDHGGGPVEDMVARVEEMAEARGDVRVTFSTPGRFFDAISESREDLPVVADELQHHSRGCYTVVSEIKSSTRNLEVALLNSEKMCSLAFLHLGFEYPKTTLRRSWETLLFHQFHDVLGGTSIRPAYDDASRALANAKEIADSEAELAMEALSAKIATAGEAKPLLVFNAASCPREDPIHFDSILPDDEGLAVFDENGIPHPLQIHSSEDFEGKRRVSATFVGELPPLGYRVFWVRKGAAPSADLTISDSSIENSRIRIEIDPITGYLISIFDKVNGYEYLKGPSRPIVMDDQSDTWSHDVEEFRDEIGTFKIDGRPSVERGPAGASIKVNSVYGQSRMVQTYRLWSDSPTVECVIDLEWHEKHSMLKISYPVNIDRPRAIYEIPYGIIERPTLGQEEPGQRWLDVVGRDTEGRDAGMLLVNDSKYGFDVKGSEMRISIVRSPIYAFHRPREEEKGNTYLYTDQGTHRVGLLLLPHTGTSTESKFGLAERYNTPPIVAFSNPHDGPLPSSACLLECEPENVLVGALKVAEKGDRIVVRLFECAGRPTSCTLNLPLNGMVFHSHLGPWEIKTLAISRDGMLEETDLLEDHDGN